MGECDQARSNDRERRERELERANDFYCVLLGMAGHDLRQPLQMIMSAHERLTRLPHTNFGHECLRRSGFAIRRLNEQLDLLIEALRIMSIQPAVQSAPVALEPILLRLCNDHDDLAIDKGISFRIQPTRIAVMSDAVLLESILRNLVRNALKYTGPGGRVLVGCRHSGALVRVEVHDTGIGIPSDKLSTIFEAFHQLDSTQVDGLGLGLFVVRRAVDLLGHAIDVRSTVGRGSRFTVLAKAGDAIPRLKNIGR
jgi:two-component system, OmpR family, phosphate regulon sensor histidine kinase PhoR